MCTDVSPGWELDTLLRSRSLSWPPVGDGMITSVFCVSLSHEFITSLTCSYLLSGRSRPSCLNDSSTTVALGLRDFEICSPTERMMSVGVVDGVTGMDITDCSYLTITLRSPALTAETGASNAGVAMPWGGSLAIGAEIVLFNSSLLWARRCSPL